MAACVELLRLTRVCLHTGILLSLCMEFAVDNYPQIRWHDFPLPLLSEKSWKGKGRERKKKNAQEKKMFLCDIFRNTDIYSCSETLVWCGYDRIQVVSGLLFAKNYACVALKTVRLWISWWSAAAALHDTREKRDPRQWCGGANLLRWTPEWNAACYFTLQCGPLLTKLKHLICHYLFRAAERVECENPLNSNLFQSA